MIVKLVERREKTKANRGWRKGIIKEFNKKYEIIAPKAPPDAVPDI
jgi:hypothetical protein